MVMSSDIVAAPLRPRLLESVTVAPCTSRVPAITVSPELESTVNFVPATLKSDPTSKELVKVVAPPTSRVLDKLAAPVRVDAPVTESVPPTAVSPLNAATVNAVVATLKSPVDPRAPATATDALLSVMMSVSPVMPILVSVNRTDSTSTYPALLVIARPPVDAVCVKAAVALDSFKSSVTVSVPANSTALSDRVMRSASLVVPILGLPIGSSVKRTDSTSTNPAVLEMVRPVVAPTVPAVCVIAAEISESLKSSDTWRTPATVTASSARVMRSASLVVPILLSVNRTNSTSTY